MQSAERVSQIDASDNYVFQRSLLAYHFAAGIVGGDLLEIGTGSGYGIDILAPNVASFITVDRKAPVAGSISRGNVEFHRMSVPPLRGLPSSSFDHVICFQVIEHIVRDFLLLDEIRRVLRPGGTLIISTPNIRMTLVRNPWHVREYTADEFTNLLASRFSRVEPLGVFGRGRAMEYYERNRRSVARILRFDPLRLHALLPRRILRLPFDAANRINRRLLFRGDRALASGITTDDYYIDTVSDDCFDLLFVAVK